MIFLVFCGIFLMMNWVTVNIYLFVWDAMMLATACGYLKRENEAFLRKILRVSLISAVAYVLVRIVRGNIFSWSPEGRSWVFYALTVIAVGLVTVFFVSLWKYRKSGNMESGQETSGKEGTGDGVTETLLKSRKHDLKRVETYLEQVHIVGINGEWGTGKTFLMEEFCRKHGEEYEFVRVDLLTCNLDQVDVFLLQEMEAILRKHRIYPRYSRSLCNMMKDHSWLKDLRELLRQLLHQRHQLFPNLLSHNEADHHLAGMLPAPQIQVPQFPFSAGFFIHRNPIFSHKLQHDTSNFPKQFRL